MHRSVPLEKLRRFTIAISHLAALIPNAIRLNIIASRIHSVIGNFTNTLPVRISRNFVPQLGDRVLQPMQFVTQHVELSLTESNIARSCRRGTGNCIAIFGPGHGNRGRGLIGILSLIGGMI